MSYRRAVLLALLLCLACVSGDAADKAANPSFAGSPYLFVWSADAAHKASDFLSVVDVSESSPTYGRIVATVPVGASATMPHHTEYEFAPDNILFANGWMAGQT